MLRDKERGAQIVSGYTVRSWFGTNQDFAEKTEKKHINKEKLQDSKNWTVTSNCLHCFKPKTPELKISFPPALGQAVKFRKRFWSGLQPISI